MRVSQCVCVACACVNVCVHVCASTCVTLCVCARVCISAFAQQASDVFASADHCGVGECSASVQGRAFGERHRGVDRVDTAISGDIKPCRNIRHVAQRKHVLHLLGANLVHIHAAMFVESGHPTELL